MSTGPPAPANGIRPLVVVIIDTFTTYQRAIIRRLAERADAAGYDVDTAVVAGFVQRFAHRPLVSIGMPVDGVTSVGGDDAATTLALLRHMTADPARRRFAFLRGHRGSHEGCERERPFRQVMGERGLPIDETLVMDAHFS